MKVASETVARTHMRRAVAFIRGLLYAVHLRCIGDPVRCIVVKVISRAELNRQAIVDRALDIADAEGLDAITVRRISKEFGVTPMALYWHVANKDELLAAMGDALFADISTELDPDEGWLEQLRTMVMRLVAALRRHPGSASLAYAQVLQCQTGLQMAEVVFGLLIDGAGFDNVEAAHIGAQALRTAVVTVTDEPGRAFGNSDEARDALRETKRAHLAALPAATYPHLHQVGEPLLDCDRDEYYRLGIDLYIAGVERLAARAGAQSAS
jgi:TetR/AcrR family tetracycline transcriptional repressor